MPKKTDTTVDKLLKLVDQQQGTIEALQTALLNMTDHYSQSESARRENELRRQLNRVRREVAP